VSSDPLIADQVPAVREELSYVEPSTSHDEHLSGKDRFRARIAPRPAQMQSTASDRLQYVVYSMRRIRQAPETESSAAGDAGNGTRRPDASAIRDILVVALTVLTGATDAIAFTKLGGVFTSVMTGNMVLLGVAVGRGVLTLLAHTGVAFAAYIAGSMAGGRIAGQRSPQDGLWPFSMTATLTVEFALFLTFGVFWWSSHAAPAAWMTSAMLAICAAALGLQSSAVLRLGIPGLSTTYLTGTLTVVVNALANGRRLSGNGRAALTLLGLIAGAILGGITASRAPDLAPAIPIAILAGTIGIALVAFSSDGAPASTTMGSGGAKSQPESGR
jgi:uncharacterized membrane protein YoaK (UPF0700 family)